MKLKLLIGIIALFSSTIICAQDSTKVREINEVVVTSSRMQLPLKNIPQKVEIISQSLIDAIPNENVGEILKRTTNLDVIQYPGSIVTVGLRGFPATVHNRNYTLILIDGLPAGTNNLATIPSDFIERIEVVKGPYAVLYGSDAMGGIINVITKKSSRDTKGSVGIGIGTSGQANYSGYVSSAISPKLLFSMGFSRQERNKDYQIGSHNLLKLSDTEKNILDKKSYGDVMTNTTYQMNQFNGKLEYLIDNKWSAKLYSSLTVSNDIETPGNYWHNYGMSKKDINRIANYGELKYEEQNNQLVISPYLSVQNDANYDNNTDQAFINSKERIRQSGIKIGNTHTWGNLKWLVGLDYDEYKVAAERFSEKLTPTNPYRPDHLRQSLSGFSQLAYSWNNLFINAGVRYNYITYTLEASSLLKNDKSSEHYSNLNPSVGIKYNVSKNLNVHASLGSAFYVPDAYKTAGSYTIGSKIYIGNKNLKPETSTSYDIGINYSINDYLNVDATYFQNFYKNKIVDDKSKKDTISYKNASNGVMQGIELMLSSNIAKLWNAPYKLELYGGTTYSFKNTFDDVATDGSKITKQTLYTRKATANFGIHFENKNGFEARLNSRYIGHRLENDYIAYYKSRPGIEASNYYAEGGYTDKDQILRHSEHFVFDFSSYYSINRKIRIGISLSNLLDENYTEKDGYNMPGRSAMGNVSYKF